MGMALRWGVVFLLGDIIGGRFSSFFFGFLIKKRRGNFFCYWMAGRGVARYDGGAMRGHFFCVNDIFWALMILAAYSRLPLRLVLICALLIDFQGARANAAGGLLCAG